MSEFSLADSAEGQLDDVIDLLGRIVPTLEHMSKCCGGIGCKRADEAKALLPEVQEYLK